MQTKTILLATALSASAILGCGTSSAPPTDHSDQGYDAAHSGHDHAHAHDEGGPHGGHLIELGDEAYHVEWLHDDETGLVTIYVLDDEMANEVPIASPTVRIERSIDGDTTSVSLAAVADESGRAARFEVTDKALIEALKLAGKGVEAKLFIEIEGQAFTADFSHEAH